mgnify:CR=1 FL=1|tara:strand:+ start:255 stop:1106 length:852 start_codon:yes stop_codon:yes gene_type:complete
MSKNPPIIIAGMHRSGTSLVTNILSKSGLVVGEKLDSNNESIFFQRINIWMMSLLGSSWDSPRSFKDIDEEIRLDIIRQLNTLISSRTNSLYFGWSSIIKKGSFNQIDVPWGWKDPRNSFTSDIWKEVFPGMKTIYIIRHPIDTAESLLRRQKNEKNRDINRQIQYSDLIKSILSITHTNYNSSMLLNTYDNCFSLIESYYSQILANKDGDSLVIKFEDIISNPDIEIQKMLNYCNLTPNQDEISGAINNIDKSKSYAYRKNPDLLKFESSFNQLIEDMGYSY